MLNNIAKKRNNIGVQGQSIVQAALISRGFSIIDTNISIRINGVSIGEIDMIARKNKIIYIIEIKMRIEETDIIPWSKAQKKRFLRAADILASRRKYTSVRGMFAFISGGVCRFYEV